VFLFVSILGKIYKIVNIDFFMVAVFVWVLIGLVALIILTFAYYFNRFVVLNNNIDNSLSQIDVQLRKRADLVPNLVDTVQGYAKHEKKIMADVTKAREALLGAGDFRERVKAGNQLQSALRSIFAIAENYPQLRANENFLHLQQELSAIEDKIAYSRQYYNDSVLSFNNAVEVFPAMMFARIYGKTKKEFLQIPKEMKAVPKVKF
jgi:LemA protein